MVLMQMAVHGFGFALVANGYLLLVMLATSPRIRGYSDHPEVVRATVPPQTRREKLAGAILGAPWLPFILGYPVFSTYAM